MTTNPGMSRDEVLENLSMLSEHDREEVLEYIEQGVYFLGRSSMTTESKYHHDYGYYQANRGNHIIYRYEVLEQIGRGCYGLVVSAFDHKLKINVAIKVMKKGNSNTEKFYDEIRVYEYLNMCYKEAIPELIQMLGNFVYRGYCFIVLNKCHKDLNYQLLKNGYEGFRLEKVKRIVKSMLVGLKSLHSVNLTHGDMKPDNIASTSRNSTTVSLLDLGNAKYGNQEFRAYDQCRYYRAPEIILHLTYGPAVDIWALGCIAYKLATGNILFKGNTKDDQLFSIMKVLGVPPKNMIQSSTVAHKYFYPNHVPKQWHYFPTQNSYLLTQLSHKHSVCRSLKTIDPFSKLKKKSPAFVDFLKKCLDWDVHRRMTATEALSHQWLLDRRVRSIRKCSQRKEKKKSISTQTIANRKLREASLETNQKLTRKLSKSLSVIDYGESKRDIHARWLCARAKFLSKTQHI